jgi:succinyl-CoA synthetase beta subunit
VLKSQLTVGGRGKAGAIVKCKSEAELQPKFNELLYKEVKGELPRGILLEEMADIKKELYLSLFLNRSKRCYSLISSTEGGVEIESAGNKVMVDVPLDGLTAQTAEEVATKLGLSGRTVVCRLYGKAVKTGERKGSRACRDKPGRNSWRRVAHGA